MANETKGENVRVVRLHTTDSGAKLSDPGVRERTRARMQAIAQDPEKARAFLQEAGIIASSGGLTTRFGG